MYELPKCVCGEELEFNYDTGIWCDGDVATMASFGQCPKCGKKYRWLDHYELFSWSELEEETE